MNSNGSLISSVVCSIIIRQSRFGRWAGGVHCASWHLLKSIFVLRSTAKSAPVPANQEALLIRRTCSKYELRRVKRKKRILRSSPCTPSRISEFERILLFQTVWLCKAAAVCQKSFTPPPNCQLGTDRCEGLLFFLNFF